MKRLARTDGFTLIELLVVIAIIAIMGAILMPALSSATDRARVTECRSNLTHISIALRMYFNDYGVYPDRLPALTQAGILTDDTMLLCSKTGGLYYYEAPTAQTAFDQTIACCVAPDTPVGQRPHSYRESYLALQKGGKITETGR